MGARASVCGSTNSRFGTAPGPSMSRRALLLTLYVLALGPTLVTTTASAETNEPCSSPRSAVQTWIDHLQQDNFRPSV